MTTGLAAWSADATNVLSYTIGPATMTSGYMTISGTSFDISAGNQKEGISPGLYFRFMKSKLNKIQKEKLKKNLGKLKALLDDAETIEQKGYAEELGKMLVIACREQEALVCGISQYIDRQLVEKFRDKVKDRVIRFEFLSRFPRPIPDKQRNVIKICQRRRLFDEYHVLYTDYTDQKSAKTTREKIIEKDPICFGTYSYAPDRLYFICDWIDEHCDLTMDKILDKIQIEATHTPRIDGKYVEKLRAEVDRRHKVLQATNSGNFRQLAADEGKPGKKSWWRRWFR